MTVPMAFAGAQDLKETGSCASASAERSIYDALYSLIAPSIERAIEEWEHS